MQIQDIPQVNKGQVRVLVQMAMLVVEHPSPLLRVSMQVRVLFRVLCDSLGVDEGEHAGRVRGGGRQIVQESGREERWCWKGLRVGERQWERGVRVLVRVLSDSEGVDEGAIQGEFAGDRESVGAGEGRVLLRVRIWGQ
jgi:hypothetical protein